MSFSVWSIKNPVPTLLFFILVTLLGLIGFHKLGIQQFPDMELPTIQVSASLEGAAPAQLETEVASKIEDSLASLSRLKHITTTITDGSVSINAEFALEKDSEVALNEVRNAVQSIEGDLPSSMNSPTVSKDTTESSSLLTYAVSSTSMDQQDLSWFIDNDVTKAVLSAKGVGAVTRIGGVEREIHVDLNPSLMMGLGISTETVSNQLKAMQKDSSGGSGRINSQRQSFRTLGAVSSVDEIAAISIPVSDNRYVRLDQIATVTDTHEEASSLAYRDGKPIVAFQVQRSKGFSDVGVVDRVRSTVQKFAAQHPEVSIKEINTTVTPILNNYEGSMHLLLEGAILAIVVVWLFLRDMRATIISATALPLSIIPAFGMMYVMDFSLNTISLLALALVIGILVDDAIVEVENIARHMRNGKSAREAAMEAADEIGLAVIATTLTLVAVFLPTAFMGGIPGKIFRQFGLTASVAVLASLVVARMLTPMLAAYFMKPHEEEITDGRVMTSYLTTVKHCLNTPRRTALVAAFLFILSLGLIPLLPTGFFPAQDDAQSQVSITLPPGSTLEDTRKITDQASQMLRKNIPEVEHVISSVGEASSGKGHEATSNASVNAATLTIDLVQRSERDDKQSVVEARMRKLLKQIPGARIEVGRGGNGEQLQVTLASDDPTALTQAATSVETALRTLHGIGNVTSAAAVQRPEIQITPNDTRAAALGVTSEELSNTIRLATYGTYSSNLPKLNLPQRQVPIRVRFGDSVQHNLDLIRQLRTTGTNGDVALQTVADVKFGSGPTQIDRLDRSRYVTLNVELNGRAIGEVMQEARQLPAIQNLPPSVHLVEQGELERMDELFDSFGLAMGIGIFCIYAVLVLLFHDFLQPVTILSALPLSIGGALLALLATGHSISMPTVIGLLMLMGIVTKNSILLVEYGILARRQFGMGRIDALLDACHKRARPILMTTIAMGAGMLPIAMGLGADPSFRQPMAIVVIGGLLASTVLSLLVVPVIFLLIDDVLEWIKRLISRKNHDSQTQSAS